MKNINYFLLLFVVLIYSCRTDDLNTEIIDGNPIVDKYYESDVEGVILNDIGEPLSGVKVLANNMEQITDENGVFLFKDIIAPESGILLRALKDNHFEIVKNIAIAESSSYKIVQKLSEFTNDYTFESSEGINIFLEDGGKIEVPQNALNLNGQTYNGTVQLFAKYLDPKNSKNAKQLPANLKGIDISGDEIAVQSHGIIAVELFTNNGDLLTIKQESALIIKAPNTNGAPSNLLESYKLDQSTGLWQWVSNVVEEDGFFVSNVKGTGWINFGEGSPGTQIILDVMNESLLPASGENFLIHDGLNYIFSYSNESGKVSSFVPIEKDFSVSTFGYCGEQIPVDNLGTIVKDQNQIVVKISELNDSRINLSGKLYNCDATTIGCGYTLINSGSNLFFDHVNTEGTYEMAFSFCENKPDDLSILAKDVELLTSSVSTIEINTNNTYINDINSCQNAISFFNYNDLNNTELKIEGCVARQTKEELLITAKDQNGNNAILGILGFGKGTYTANLFASGFQGTEQGETEVEIKTYEEVGGFIKGSFKNGGTEGDFVAKRIR